MTKESRHTVAQASFSFKFNEDLELSLKNYLEKNRRQEILGGLIGKIKGGTKNEIVFHIIHFLPFPNLAENPQFFAKPPELWFEILEEWRVFYHSSLQFVGFLHTHPISSSKISEPDIEFAQFLEQKYGSIVFFIVSQNSDLRCYMFDQEDYRLINGSLKYYKIIMK
ncbi:MAG: hypothetical protein ACOC44_07560 [Promethearchaeia archaeon]